MTNRTTLSTQLERVPSAYERYFASRNFDTAPQVAKRRIMELLRILLTSSKIELHGYHNIFFELLEIYDFFEYVEGVDME